MNEKFRVCGKNLSLTYPNFSQNPERFKSIVFFKLKNYEIQDHLFLFQEETGIFVYIRLSKKSRPVDTVDTSFFDIEGIHGKYKNIPAFGYFCDEICPLLKGKKKFVRIGTEKLAEEFQLRLGEETEEEVIQTGWEEEEKPLPAKEDLISHFFDFQEQSTNYSCRSPSSHIPSKDSSLSSTTRVRLEEENLKLRSFYEEKLLESRQEIACLRSQVFQMNSEVSEMKSLMHKMYTQILLLNQENQELRNDNQELRNGHP